MISTLQKNAIEIVKYLRKFGESGKFAADSVWNDSISLECLFHLDCDVFFAEKSEEN